MLVEPWSVTLLGQLKAEQNLSTITRFRTRKAASLFAFLACHRNRSHAREELADRFWPEDTAETGRTKLRLALTSLRHQLEPAGVQAGAVLVADRTHVRLHPDALETDVAAFESDLSQAQHATEPQERIRLIIRAIHGYGGDLLPGDYEEWALIERERLRHAYLEGLTQLVMLSAAQKDLNAAITYARRLVTEDPLQEAAHLALMRLYLRGNRPQYAAQQYAELVGVIKQAFGGLPGSEAQALAATLPAIAARKPDPAEKPPSRTDPSPSPSLDLRLPLFLTRCFGRYEAVRALASLLDAEAHADIKANQDLHYDFAAAPEIGTLFRSDASGQNAEKQARLITLTGPGGAGKTRLAVETAHFLHAKVGYPIAFIGLAEVTDTDQILRSVADALRLPHIAHADPLAQIADRLQSGPALLVLDNFEQLTPNGLVVVQALLTRLPALRCLVTSRHHLGLPGERTFAVEPLPVSASQQLFLDRAQATRPDFQITPHNARAVALLCEQLEGIPLALELAAAWIGVLTPTQMLTRMNRRFDLLISRRNDRVPRHHALHATIAWSYELLSPELQTFLTRLSVFRSGWTEQAAQEVAGTRHALHLLAQLRERSLVVAEESEDATTMRFRLLESIREFADTTWEETPPENTRRLHAAYFLHMAEEADQNIAGPDQAYWFACLEPERPNIAAAWEWLAGEADGIEAHLRLTVAMRIFWRTQGYLTESRQRLNAVAARPGVEAFPASHGLALVEIGLVASMQGNQETAHTYAEQALQLARSNNDRSLEASALNTLGNVAKRRREFEAAHNLYVQCLEISREIVDRRSEATAVANLGNLAQEQENYAHAAQCYQQSIAVYRQMQHKQGLVIQLYNLAGLHVQTDDYVGATPLLAECLTLCRELRDTPTMMHVMEVFGFVADEFAQSALAVELYAAAARLRKDLGLPMSDRGRDYMNEVLAASRVSIGDERFERLWQAGTEASLEQTLALAEQIRIPAALTALDKAG